MSHQKKRKHEASLWLPLSLLQSPVWQKRSINCRRLLHFLAIEDVRNAGRENGQLHATYQQLRLFGIPQRKITDAIIEAEALGLIEVEHGPRVGITSAMSKFRLTYTRVYKDGTSLAPTNEWRQLDEQAVNNILKELKVKKENKKIRKSMLQSDSHALPLKASQRIH